MINLDQAHLLEKKVAAALELISRLRDENRKLRTKLDGSQKRMTELESLVESFKGEQDAIEKSILNVLAKLDRIEDDISAAGGAGKKQPPSPPLPEAGQDPADEPKRKQDKKTAAEKSENNGEISPPGESANEPGKQDELDIF